MSLIASLIEEHGEIEVVLDAFAAAIATRHIDQQMFRELAALNAQHYFREEKFLDILQTHHPRLASKLRTQHEEVLEIATRLDESLSAADTADVLYLARRFLAI